MFLEHARPTRSRFSRRHGLASAPSHSGFVVHSVLTLVADAGLALLAGTVGALNAIGRKQHLAHAATKRVWKDAVLVRAGPTVDMVVDVSNPGLRGWRTATSPNTPRAACCSASP
jgi:hypothetical protein